MIATLSFVIENIDLYTPCADPGGGGGGFHGPDPLLNFGKNVVIGFVSGTGFILNSIYVEYNLE